MTSAAPVTRSTPWHATDVAAVLGELDTDPETGLGVDDTRVRLETHGRNELDTTGGPSRMAILLEQFNDVLVWLLLGAAIISGALLGEWLDAGVILAIVVLNALIGFIQEARAEDALTALQEMSAPDALVIRDGAEQHIAAAELVPGDIVVLEPGNRVPADSRVVEAIGLRTDEAPLTGESTTVRKDTAPVDADVGVGDRHSMVFAGTSVAAGRAKVAVVATGRHTEVGKIADMLGGDEPETPLTKELDRVGKRIALLTLVVAVLMFGVGLARSVEPETMFLIAVALAVAAIPEGLPAVVTITLSRGVTQMARNKAIVRRLAAVEALGSATVICSDKTGTLTRNEMRVQQLAFADMSTEPEGMTVADARMARYADVAVLCNDARPTRDGYEGDPTEIALLVSAHPALVDAVKLRERAPRVNEISFDSARKRMTTVHRAPDVDEGEGWFVATKGAPEVVLERSTHLLGPDSPMALGDERRRHAAELADRYAAEGLRTLALAYREVGDLPAETDDLESGLVLVAIVGMSDELRPETRPAVDAARAAGIDVVMVTGDHEVTARAIADDLAMLDGRNVMGGATLRDTEPDDLASTVDEYAVYARVDPADKVKIVKAWQEQGAIVAMTGDGVNDAPALQSADIGVAMGSGTDVAKESADMVLADDNFATILGAVREGRKIFSNLKKVVYFLLSANLSEVVVMFFGFLLFGGLGEPLLATQLLWVNLVTDGIPAIALGVDPAVPGLMSRRPDTERDILGPAHQLRLLWQGGLIALGVLATFVYGYTIRGEEWGYVRTMALTTLVIGQLLHVFNVRAQGTSVWKVGFTSNPLLLWGIVTSFALHLMVVYTPLGQQLFETEPLPIADWPAMVLLGVIPFLLIDAIKRWTLRRHPDSAAAMD